MAIFGQTDALSWQGGALSDLAEVLEEAGCHEEALATFRDAMDRYARKGNLAMLTQVQDRLDSVTRESTDMGQ